MNVADAMILHLRSVERAKQPENLGVRSAAAWTIPVPVTWRLADELLMLLGVPAPGIPSDATGADVIAFLRDRPHVSPESWVASPQGAEAAIRFYRLMQGALLSHPMEERSYPMRMTACPKCKFRSFVWHPPLEFFDDVEIRCSTEGCGYVMSQGFYESAVRIEQQAKGGRRWAA